MLNVYNYAKLFVVYSGSQHANLCYLMSMGFATLSSITLPIIRAFVILHTFGASWISLSFLFFKTVLYLDRLMLLHLLFYTLLLTMFVILYRPTNHELRIPLITPTINSEYLSSHNSEPSICIYFITLTHLSQTADFCLG